MEKFKVSYQQIYSWIRKYDEKGVDGLIYCRGKAKPESELTYEDRLKAKNKLLEVENNRLRLENAIARHIHYYNYERYQEGLNNMTRMGHYAYLNAS